MGQLFEVDLLLTVCKCLTHLTFKQVHYFKAVYSGYVFTPTTSWVLRVSVEQDQMTHFSPKPITNRKREVWQCKTNSVYQYTVQCGTGTVIASWPSYIQMISKWENFQREKILWLKLNFHSATDRKLLMIYRWLLLANVSVLLILSRIDIIFFVLCR